MRHLAMAGQFGDGPPACVVRSRSATAEALDELRAEWNMAGWDIQDAPRGTVSRTFRRRWRQQLANFLRWYSRFRMSPDLAEPSLSCMVEAWAEELAMWRRQAAGDGVTFVSVSGASTPGPARHLPVYITAVRPLRTVATLQTRRTMGGLTEPNIATPRDAWTAVLRSGPKAGGSACHIAVGASWTGQLKLMTPVRYGPAYTYLAGQGEEAPVVWTPARVNERLDYVNAQWLRLEEDVRRAEPQVASGEIPVAWKRAFGVALGEWQAYYRRHHGSLAPLTFGLLGYRDVAIETNNYLRRLIRWREQFVAHGGEVTGPAPEEQEFPGIPGATRAGSELNKILIAVAGLVALVAIVMVLK